MIFLKGGYLSTVRTGMYRIKRFWLTAHRLKIREQSRKTVMELRNSYRLQMQPSQSRSSTITHLFVVLLGEHTFCTARHTNMQHIVLFSA